MFDLEKLKDIGESFATYVIFAAVLSIAGGLIMTLNRWPEWGFVKTLANILVSPGHMLLVGGFMAAGIAGETVPSSVRVTAVIMGTLLFLRFVIQWAMPSMPF